MQSNIHEDCYPQVSGHHLGASADASDIDRTVDLNIAKRQGEGPVCDAALEYAQRSSQKYSGTRWGSTTDLKVIRSAFRKFADANVATKSRPVSIFGATVAW
jgi:hypothetical protein